MKQSQRKSAQYIYEKEKPVAVIVDIKKYEDLLEKAEQAEDLKALRLIRKKPMHFRTFDSFLKDSRMNV